MRSSHKSFHFRGGKLFLCDMRPGFSEDGIAVSLPGGDYDLSVDSIPQDLTGFSLILTGSTPDKFTTKGRIDIDMARVGVFDRAVFTQIFAGDAEALFEWSSDASSRKSAQWGGFLRHRPSGECALYVNTGSDCTCSVQLLLAQNRPVGVRVIPKVAAPVRAIKLQQYVTLEVKCRGIGPPWQCCVANNDELKFDDILEDVLEDVLAEVSLDDISCDSIDPESIDLDAPISRYQPRFNGIAKISLFMSSDGALERKLLSALTSPKLLPRHVTSRQLARFLHDLIQNARERAEQGAAGQPLGFPSASDVHSNSNLNPASNVRRHPSGASA